ncbi:hypothetical protein HS1genome_0147 [Sulfodiicoccus acidiphilus]|uniref:Uncharacterized protein n=1 Tax=Sulfodiicoccus acidiphilus TaxID=1670455 RepID=A0A348B0Q6_9CREN|nr:hypothetical protein HS1genome_0147 [Sulfodiicoccus acidiphilus]GGT86117.1 hypothetical protein GCM10007116_00010 [Sulfodiicoccus acidiphilus]
MALRERNSRQGRLEEIESVWLREGAIVSEFLVTNPLTHLLAALEGFPSYGSSFPPSVRVHVPGGQ